MMENSNAYLRLLRAAEEVSGILSKDLGDNLVASYVYGSVARGDCRESSDVDLHIVLSDYAQAKDVPHRKWVRNVQVDISPHPLSFYKTTPEWLLENINIVAGWEGLWEMAKIIVLYDPDNLVSSFREKITPVLNSKPLLKARANISFKAAMTEVAKVKKELSEGALDQALCYMYSLGGGGDEYSGAAVHVLKTVVKFSGLPLTTSRIWLRFKEACHKLNAPNLQNLMEHCYGMDQPDQRGPQDVVGEACHLADEVARSPVPEETKHGIERFKLAVAEYMKKGEIEAAHVFILGRFSSTHLELSSERWQKQAHLKLQELLFKTAGLRSQRELEDRMRAMLEAMNNIEKEMLSC